MHGPSCPPPALSLIKQRLSFSSICTVFGFLLTSLFCSCRRAQSVQRRGFLSTSRHDLRSDLRLYAECSDPCSDLCTRPGHSFTFVWSVAESGPKPGTAQPLHSSGPSLCVPAEERRLRAESGLWWRSGCDSAC